MPKASTYFFLAFFTLFLLALLYPELRDLYGYFGAESCNPSCEVFYKIRVIYAGEGGLGEIHYSREVRLNSSLSVIRVEVGNNSETVFPAKTSIAGCKISGYRLSPTSPSLAYCQTSINNSFLGFLKLRDTVRGFGNNYLLVYGSKTFNRPTGFVRVIARLENTTCTYKCFELNTGYYAFILLLKMVFVVSVAILAYMARRVWGRRGR